MYLKMRSVHREAESSTMISSCYCFAFCRANDADEMYLGNTPAVMAAGEVANRAQALLSQFKTPVISDESSTKELTMMLFGLGGTGKSRTIDAIVYFAVGWDMRSSLVITALTGAAAALIGGRTLEGAIGTGISFHLHNPKPDHLAAWSQVYLMLIDEVSLCGAAKLDKLDRRLQQLKGNEHTFGGIGVIFAGDFHQLRPVNDTALYDGTYYEGSAQIKSPPGDPQAQTRSAKGLATWSHCLNAAVHLQSQHRFKDDPYYGSVMERFSTNQISAEDVDYINQRIISRQNVPPPNQVFAAAANEEKASFNHLHMSQMIGQHRVSAEDAPSQAWTERGQLRIVADMEAAAGFHIKTTMWPYLRSLDSTKMKDLEGNLDLYVGRAVANMQGGDVGGRGIAKNSQAVFVHAELKAGAVVTFQETEEGQGIYSVPASQVAYVILKHTTPPWNTRDLFEGAPPSCAGMFPVKLVERTCTVKVQNQNFKFKMKQLPIVALNAVTGHKVQGRTLPNIIVGSWSQSYRYGQDGWMYVVLSRVRTHKGLFLTELLSSADMDKYKPRERVMAEVRRLIKLAAATKAALTAATDPDVLRQADQRSAVTRKNVTAPHPSRGLLIPHEKTAAIARTRAASPSPPPHTADTDSATHQALPSYGSALPQRAKTTTTNQFKPPPPPTADASLRKSKGQPKIAKSNKRYI
jgi:hypothetical protein